MLLSAGRLHLPAQDTVDIPDRYELKYVISESQTDAVRRAIEPFCVRDPHADRDADHAYSIQSLYLDTPTHRLFRMSQERQARRWKARIRCYDGSASVFLEIKGKDHDMVKKQRALIPAAGWALRLRARVADDASPAERCFRDRLERFELRPSLLVRYRREAWLSTVDTYARITFDRRIVCQPCPDWSLAADERAWIAIDDARALSGVPRGTVLELKCLRAVPRWLVQLTGNLGLTKARYSKYCKGLGCVAERGRWLGLVDST